MRVWLCIWIPLKTAIQCYTVEKIVDSPEKARKWKDKGDHHMGADLRFWTPVIISMEVQ